MGRRLMARQLFALPDGQAVCVNPGGQWHGWIFKRHPDGYWVSTFKLAEIIDEPTARKVQEMSPAAAG